jgi:formylglycine-generating enzyme required for sulfatase activity
VGKFLLPPLASFLGDEKHNGSERNTIAVLYGRFAEGLPDAFTRFESMLAERSRADATVEEKISLAKRQANLGVALVFLGRGDKVWPLLAHSPDPTTRTYLIERLGQLTDPQPLVERLDDKRATGGQDGEPEVSVRRALVLALGTFGPDRLPQAELDRLLPRLRRWYDEDPDPGVHASAEWLLRTWGKADKLTGVNEGRPAGRREGGRMWSVNGLGQTFMVVRGPAEFWTGDGTRRRRQRIPGSFAIASKEVTAEDFLRFLQTVGDRRDADGHHPTAGSPAKGVSWYEAAHYCNWLSQREGVPKEEWCYLPNKNGVYAAGMRLAPDCLRKRGYRLPTESEWEFACRAGARTEWACGDVDKELLGRYARWYGNSYSDRVNKPSPVGTLKPNDWGLFDMHGNVSEWCHNRFENSSEARENEGGEAGGIRDEEHRAVRGGSYTAHFGDVTSAFRFGLSPSFPGPGVGFRPVRTLP